MLAEFYNQLSEDDANNLEIVFASSDSDDSSFNSYYGEMPWVSIPFSNNSSKEVINI